MKQEFKTTIRLSWDDLDLLTAYQTAKDIPSRTEAIMKAVREVCDREKITVSILPEKMRAAYYMINHKPKQPEPIEEEEEEEEEKYTAWNCPFERLYRKKERTIDDCRLCPDTKFSICEKIEEWAKKEIIAERATKKREVPKQEETEKKQEPTGSTEEGPKSEAKVQANQYFDEVFSQGKDEQKTL